MKATGGCASRLLDEALMDATVKSNALREVSHSHLTSVGGVGPLKASAGVWIQVATNREQWTNPVSLLVCTVHLKASVSNRLLMKSNSFSHSLFSKVPATRRIPHRSNAGRPDVNTSPTRQFGKA